MRLAILSISLMLLACAMALEFVRPESPVAAQFPHQSGEADGLRSAADIGWQSMFGDPRLQALIEAALKNNRDLRIATLNVEAARASFHAQRAEQLPAIGATAGLTRERSRAQSETPTAQREVSAGIGVSAFELDLWGRLQSLSDAAFSRYLASDEGRRAAQLSLIATVAEAYFAERLAVEQKALAS